MKPMPMPVTAPARALGAVDSESRPMRAAPSPKVTSSRMMLVVLSPFARGPGIAEGGASPWERAAVVCLPGRGRRLWVRPRSCLLEGFGELVDGAVVPLGQQHVPDPEDERCRPVHDAEHDQGRYTGVVGELVGAR